MSCKKDSNYIENRCSESRSNKLDKYIKDCQNGIVTLPERQFNCPACIQFKKSSCQIPSWVKPPCDGLFVYSLFIYFIYLFFFNRYEMF